MSRSSPVTDPAENKSPPSKRGHSFLSPLLIFGYRFRILRPVVRWALDVFEGGEIYSDSLRKILQASYQVQVGKYSYGPCLKPGVLPPGTIIGNYCSLAEGITMLRRNHPKDRLSTHPFFFNQILGHVASDTTHSLSENPLIIGHDVWIGFNATILPGCRRIGDGAIVGAGAMVTKNVPDFGIVVGNPGKLIGSRFTADQAEYIKRSQWWLKSMEELSRDMPLFTRQIDADVILWLERCARDQAKASDNRG